MITKSMNIGRHDAAARRAFLWTALSVLLLTGIARAESHGFVGVLFGANSVEVAFDMAGTLERVHVGMGDRVERGQLIATLRDDALRGELAQARAELRAARAGVEAAAADLAEAENRHARRAGLVDILSDEEIDALRNEVRRQQARRELASADSDAAAARVERLELELDRMSLRAPFAGSVAIVLRRAREGVAARQPVLRLVDAAEPWVRFAVPRSDARWLRLGAPIEIAVDGSERAYAGAIRHISPEVELASDTIFVEARVELGEFGFARAGDMVRVRQAPEALALRQP